MKFVMAKIDKLSRIGDCIWSRIRQDAGSARKKKVKTPEHIDLRIKIISENDIRFDHGLPKVRASNQEIELNPCNNSESNWKNYLEDRAIDPCGDLLVDQNDGKAKP
jgi:hypothetical protein